ncbi:MAG TPA: E2/UBC family protein [Acidimicrobiia bacterium]|nr:E2/UBC family protein [Acidimicrobiia bacterium]
MSLPESDIAFLDRRDATYQVTVESGMTCVVLEQWQLPSGFDHDTADLLIRLNPGYPDVQPDMWWFDPPVHLANGQSLPATNAVEQHLGRSWQRWSRHFPAGQWQAGIDGLESFLALIRHDLHRSVPETSR